jgi:RNA polymerase sigma-70 factor (ECF subfamily)
MELAEDIASETFLKAMETWGSRGLPANPTAWLYTVARNKAKDHFKHTAVFESKIKDAIRPDATGSEEDFEFTDQNIADSQLAMIFAVCNPCNAAESQISLALQILCGFSVEEIANAFLTQVETIKKRLQRARANLADDKLLLRTLSEAEITQRLDAVLKTLYLLFNEGYFSKTNNQLIRKDLCSEAIRLALLLTGNAITSTPKANALLALMCFQSSRLDARTNDKGEVILFDQQDRNLWDKTLIEKGNTYLVNACRGNEISRYHLEAAIAYWHTTADEQNKWPHILELYNQLIIAEYSPITALNRTFALAKVQGHAVAIAEAEKLNLTESNLYHSLLGYLYADTDVKRAIEYYSRALELTKSPAQKQNLEAELERLEGRRVSAS